MILKSLSRSSSNNGSGGTGQLLNYIFRYVLEKEQAAKKEKDVKVSVLSKADIPYLMETFKNGNLNFESHPDQHVPTQQSIAEQELDTAIRISKNTAIGKEFVKHQKAQGIDVKNTTLHITSNYLIARAKNGDRFFKLSLPTLFSNAQIPKNKDPAFIIRHNVRARSIKGYIREFQKVEALRTHTRSNQVSVYHYIISFSPQDKAHVTDAMLKDIAGKFIELRGPDNLYVGTKHADREHIHLHLAMSAVDLAGRSVRLSKSKFQSLKIELDRYQVEKYPLLSHSLPDHGKKSRAKHKEAVQEIVKTRRTTDKVTLLSVLEKTYAQSTSTEHFLSQLKDQGYPAYYRSGTLTGISVDGQRKFRLARLGYTTEKLTALDLAKAQEEKELNGLKALREQNTRYRTQARLASINELHKEANDENKELEENQSSVNSQRDSSRDTKEGSSEERQPDRNAQEQERDINEQENSRDGDSRDR